MNAKDINGNYLVGFHFGPGGNRNGWIQNYLLPLTEAGIPAVIKSVDDPGPLIEAQAIAIASGVPHHLIWRRSGNQFDVPNYNDTPRKAALDHFKLHLAEWPQDLEPELTWWETINEVDKERSEWLNEFAIETAQLILSSPYRWLAFGWSSGEPEVAHWEDIKDYLTMTAHHPHKLGVALHEYSYDDDIKNLFPYLVGRHEFLFDLMSDWGNLPTVYITEFGWHYNKLPTHEDCLAAMQWTANLYRKYPNIKGAALWYLGMGYGNIHNQAQQLLAPWAQYIIQDGYQPAPPPSPSPPDGETRIPVLIAQEATRSRYLQLAGKTYKERRTVTFSHNDAADVVVRGNDGSHVVVTDPHQPSQKRAMIWFNTYGIAYHKDGDDPPPPAPPPPPIPPDDINQIVGLHASADPGGITLEEVEEFNTLKPGVVKLLSAHAPNYVEALATDHHKATFIVRAFLHFFENGQPRHITPEQFFYDTATDMERTRQRIIAGAGPNAQIIIELHNEPNLRLEGWGDNGSGSWSGPEQFADWLSTVHALYKAEWPNIPCMYPGLSPMPDIEGVSYNYLRWLNKSQQAAAEFDYLGIHTYWSDTYPMSLALAVIDDSRSQLAPGHTPAIYITEASHNVAPGPEPDERAQQYYQFCALSAQKGVNGVTFFVATASNPAFAHETWVDHHGRSKQIAAHLRDLISA